MNFMKGAAGGNVDKVIDQAANMAKEKVGGMLGTGGKHDKKPQKGASSITDAINNTAEKAIRDAAMDKAKDSAINFGKQLFHQ